MFEKKDLKFPNCEYKLSSQMEVNEDTNKLIINEAEDMMEDTTDENELLIRGSVWKRLKSGCRSYSTLAKVVATIDGMLFTYLTIMMTANEWDWNIETIVQVIFDNILPFSLCIFSDVAVLSMGGAWSCLIWSTVHFGILHTILKELIHSFVVNIHTEWDWILGCFVLIYGIFYWIILNYFKHFTKTKHNTRRIKIGVEDISIDTKGNVTVITGETA